MWRKIEVVMMVINIEWEMCGKRLLGMNGKECGKIMWVDKRFDLVIMFDLIIFRNIDHWDASNE